MAIVYPFTPTPYHKELFDAHQPIEQGGDWFIVCGAIASMFDQIETYARDQDDGTPGWGILLDINRCPVECLPWLGQFVGVSLPPGLTEMQQRDYIRATGGFKRGSIGAIVGAAQTHLTGNKTVFYRERDSSVSSVLGGAYGLSIVTYTSETPDAAEAEADARSQKPAGIIMNFSTAAGWTYSILHSSYATYTALNAAFLTYNGLRNNAPGT